ncbi:hypothetical protein Q5P01_001013 [Channa striata]|uniref:Uncharacterized protein n=1 Tax=Channa striata TaxID=64152 RepID=A0AA88IXM8_CHASR|nr:hypothetical protein Q5P01_001013 [Channa striata]
MAEAGAAKEAGGGGRSSAKKGRALARCFGEAAPCGNYTYHEFNNLAGTLTDGPKAFPYAFTVRHDRRARCSCREAREQAEPGRGPQVLSGLQREVLQRGGSFDQDLGDSLGKIAVYQRAAVSKPKLSMRLLWYLPTELCSFEGIEAYRPLLEEIEKTSLGYTLLSYPAEASRCGLCELRGSIARGGRRDLCPRQLRLGSPAALGQALIGGQGPCSFRKCVRLRCGKEGSALNRGVRSAFGTASRTSRGRTSVPCPWVYPPTPSPRTRRRSEIVSRGSSGSAIAAASFCPSGPAVGAGPGSAGGGEALRLASYGGACDREESGSGLMCVQASERSRLTRAGAQ